MTRGYPSSTPRAVSPSFPTRRATVASTDWQTSSNIRWATPDERIQSTAHIRLYPRRYPREVCVVSGAGTMGRLVLAVPKARGAGTVVVTDVQAAKRDKAISLRPYAPLDAAAGALVDQGPAPPPGK